MHFIKKKKKKKKGQQLISNSLRFPIYSYQAHEGNRIYEQQPGSVSTWWRSNTERGDDEASTAGGSSASRSGNVAYVELSIDVTGRTD